MNNQISKRELERRLGKVVALNELATKELEKWMNGFLTACAFLKLEKPNHEFIKAMPESTMKKIDEKIAKIEESPGFLSIEKT
jgi:hypothetical protein